jgi:ABC-2 type transport system ATP-binding protein
MIEAEGLTKLYGSVPAIRDVTFQVEQGEVVGFLGPNGAGKSTAMRILTCYMPPTAGFARIGGLDCFEHSLQVRRSVGYLPENNPLYHDLTVRRFLAFAAGAKCLETRKIRHEIARVIDICGLHDVAHRIIGHLSKGYKQRVGLAQALLNNPAVLILDEPTIGLDPTQIVEIRKLIQDLREQHTILISSHILPEVAQICQRVLIINKGQIIATDTPANLTSQLQKSAQISVQVKGEVQTLIAHLESHYGVQRVSLDAEDQGRILVETDRSRDLRPDLARIILAQGMDLLELKLVDLSLEDIFMQLVTEEPAEEAIQS